MKIRVKLIRVVTLLVSALIAVGAAGGYSIYQAGAAGGSGVFFLGENPLVVFLSAAAVMTLLGGGIAFLIIRKISGSLDDLMNGITAVGSGETDAVSVNSSHEFGEISTVFNETMEKINVYRRIEEENAKNQENVINFLEVVSTASDGDFTKKAPVTTDVFGSIADAFNMMTEELSVLIKDVRSTAREFEEDSFNTLDLLKNMADGSETQMVQLRNATEAVDETAQATMEISEKTQDATELSIKAVEASQKGEELVSQSIEGMQLIRATVQRINKKMKMFSDQLLMHSI